MAYSHVVYTGDGTTTDYVVPFPYLDTSHVTATVDGVSASFSWLGASSIRFASAPGNGLAVRIQRNSSRSTRLSDYQDAQVLTEEQLDFDAKQIFYVAQEAFDAVAEAPTGGDMRRSMNLSDVYDSNAARENIGAVAKAGDTMTGPLSLSGPPSAPNHATNKAYVDATLASFAGGGVTSFNTRGGAVTLQAADVTDALDFTPVDKAGDMMTGPLILAADPSNPLQAATKQYVDSMAGGGGSASTGEYNFPNADPALAAARLTKTVTANTSDRAGAARLVVNRTGGIPMVSFMHTYTVAGASSGEGDIGIGSHIVGKSGPFAATWSAAFGPRINPGATWQPIGAQINVSERVADQGIKRDRTGSPSIAAIVAPIGPANVGDGPGIAYNTSFGIAFTAASPAASTQRTWVPLFFERDSTVPGGVQALHRGGSSPAMAPLNAIEIRDTFVSGIDMRNATLTDADVTAMWLAQGQSIHLGPLQRIFVDPSGNLSFFDNVTGLKTLNQLGGGVGTNILPLNNTWTGTNKFLGTTADAVIAADPTAWSAKVSRTSPAGGAGAVQVGFLCNTVTQATTASFEWNALFRLSNNATGGENTGLYIKSDKNSTGGTWGQVIEARAANTSGGTLTAMEIDLCSDGMDPTLNKVGIGLFYGAHTNTFGAGSSTKQTYGIWLAPFKPGRNALGHGFKIDGYADYLFHGNADGLSAFRATGAYSSAVVDISSVTSSPIAIAFAPGSRMNFSSGVGNGSNQTWFAGGFTPNYVGAIEVLIDGAKRYIPIALNHP